MSNSLLILTWFLPATLTHSGSKIISRELKLLKLFSADATVIGAIRNKLLKLLKLCSADATVTGAIRNILKLMQGREI